jgi:serine/threonine protein kinase
MVMSDFPNFLLQGYQVIRELGRNAAGGRVVYLCQTLTEPSEQVVIKQFQFAKGSGWSQYKEIEREMQVLKDLNHPGIPRYIGSLQTDDGYAIVQEFKDAPALSIPRSFEPDEIRQIALAGLEILIYLQNRMPIVIHRDIKPENILVDSDLNVYLIDFGFARIGGGEVAMSSVAVGTFGFMAPEQIYNKGLTPATDLYGLGAMLIALLTQTKSTSMDVLIDEDGRIAFRHLTPKLSQRFMEWPEKMVAPKSSDRYPHAEEALTALRSIYVNRHPAVEFSPSKLRFKAEKLGEIITQTITVRNSIADTLLEGTWSIKPHPHDSAPSPNLHKWISFSSRQLQGNEVEVDITVDTSKLMAQSMGTRSLVFHSNAVPADHSILLEVITAPLPWQTKKSPEVSMILLLITSLGLSFFIKTGLWENLDRTVVGGLLGFAAAAFFMFLCSGVPPSVAGIENRLYAGVLIGGATGIWSCGLPGGITGGTLGCLAGLMASGINVAGIIDGIGFATLALIGGLISGFTSFLASGAALESNAGILTGLIVGTLAGIMGTFADIRYAQLPAARRPSQGFCFVVLETIAIFGINFGICLQRLHPIPVLLVIFASGGLAYLLFYLPIQNNKKIAAYRQKERYLLKL